MLTTAQPPMHSSACSGRRVATRRGLWRRHGHMRAAIAARRRGVVPHERPAVRSGCFSIHKRRGCLSDRLAPSPAAAWGSMMMMMALFCLSERTPLLTHFFAHSSHSAHNQILEHFDRLVGRGSACQLRATQCFPTAVCSGSGQHPNQYHSNHAQCRHRVGASQEKVTAVRPWSRPRTDATRI